jgi:hypothetical protein
MFEYQVQIGQATYTVASDKELSNAQAYQYALAQQQAAGEGLPPRLQSEIPPNLPAGAASNGMTPEQLRAYELARGAPPELATSPTPQNQNPISPPAAPVTDAPPVAPSSFGRGVPGLTKQLDPNQPLTKPMSKQVVGSIVGSVLGATAGTALGPVGSFAGGTLGSAAGTFFGAYMDAIDKGVDPEMARGVATEETGVDILWSLGGGIFFKIGGKVVAHIADGEYARKALMSIGFKPVANAADAKVLPGQAVFGTGVEDAALRTTPKQLQQDAVEGSKYLVDAKTAPTAGQLTGAPSLGEKSARTRAPLPFRQGEAAQEGLLAERIAATRAGIKGPASTEFSGTQLKSVLDDTEKTVKETFAPVWTTLANSRGIKIVDMTDVKEKAAKLLADEGSFKVLDAAERRLLARMAKGDNTISPAEAHELQSKLFGKARDLDRATAPNSELRSLFTDFAGATRNALDKALDDAVKSGALNPKDLALITQARDTYREMMKTLYNPALDVVGPAADAGGAGHRTPLGDVAPSRALDALGDFAKKVDALGDVTIRGGKKGAAPTALSASTELVNPSAAAVRAKLPAIEGPGGANALAAFNEGAERIGKMSPEQQAQFAARNGLDAVGDAGTMARPLADRVREAQAGIRAEFLQKHMGTPEKLRDLPNRMQDPDFARTFIAQFPSNEDRRMIERLSQAAQIAGRAVQAAGGAGGSQQMASMAGRYVTGGPVGAALGLLVLMSTAEGMAKAMTRPALKADLGVVTAYLLRAAPSIGATSGADIIDMPEKVKAFFEELQK